MMIAYGITPFCIEYWRYGLVQHIDTEISENRNHHVGFRTFVYTYTATEKEEVIKLITVNGK